MQHSIVTHDAGCGYPDCVICGDDMLLQICSSCGGCEGSFTTECCGQALPWQLEYFIGLGHLDFYGGQWWFSPDKITVAPLNTCLPELFRLIEEREKRWRTPPPVEVFL